MKRFNGYPLEVVYKNDRKIGIAINTANDELFASTNNSHAALMIVNRVNFYDDLIKVLRDAHAHIFDESMRARIGKIINEAERN